MPERSKAAVLKTVSGTTRSEVRIRLPPPYTKKPVVAPEVAVFHVTCHSPGQSPGHSPGWYRGYSDQLAGGNAGCIRFSACVSASVSARRAGKRKGAKKPDKTRLARESGVTPRRLRCYGACYGPGYGGASFKHVKLQGSQHELGSSTGTGKRWDRPRFWAA